MRIERRTVEEMPDGARRISARLVFEESDFAPTVHFEAEAPTARLLEPTTELLLAAGYPLAVAAAERRVAVEGGVSPRFRDGLLALASFYGGRLGQTVHVPIQPSEGLRPLTRHAAAGTWCFMSGGVDSLALLRANRLDYPTDHPWSVSDALFVRGLNSFDWVNELEPNPERIRANKRLEKALRSFLEAQGYRLHVVSTNLRSLYPTAHRVGDLPTPPGSWHDTGYIAGTVAAAHAFPSRVSRVLLSSGGSGGLHHAEEWHYASAQLLSSEALEVQTMQLAVTRLKKLELLAEWQGVLEVLKVCFWREIPEHSLNCGHCEKCIRTMLELLALGQLDRATCFPKRKLTATDIGRIRRAEAQYVPELIEPLRARGHEALARALQRGLRNRRRRQWVRRLLQNGHR
jgi:hypothetical protein